MYIFQITLFQFVLKLPKISLVDTCNQCEKDRTVNILVEIA